MTHSPKVKHSNELEQRVLETLMSIGVSNNIRIQHAMLLLTNDCFYSPYNAELFGLIRCEFQKQNTFNFVDILVNIGTGNPELHQVLEVIIENHRLYHVSDNYFEYDVEKLVVMRSLRKQLQLLSSLNSEVLSCNDPLEAQSILIESLSEISNLNYHESKDGVSNTDLAEAFYDNKLEQDLIIPTTCEQLNTALSGGIMSKSLITVAAGAGVGKTGFAIYLLDCIARNQPDKQSLFFSLEMEAKHIWKRHVGICASNRFDNLSGDDLFQAVAKALSVPIKIYDSATCRSAADIEFIQTTSRLKAMEKPLSVIVVDYLGLVENRGNFERNDLRQSDITSKLAKLALELNCIVIALSQINRAVTTRASDDRCPYPQDAADSSGSHRSSTLWIGIDRPELYQDDPCFKNQFVVKCRKNRFGGNFDLVFAFNDGTFAEVNENHFKKPFAKRKHNPEDIFSHD